MSRKNKIRDSVADRVFQVVVVVIVTIITLTCILPIINILASSLSSANANNANIVTFWPIEITLDAYKSVVTNGALIRSMFFSIYITILTVAITLVMTILCAYPLSHRDLVGKSILWPFIMFTMYFGGGTIPNYVLVRSLGMMDTRAAMIIPGAMSVYNMIIARTFINNIPSELEEAAKVDGCTDTRFFLQMVLPLSGTVIAVLSLYYAVGHWNDYFTAFIYLKNPSKYPLQIILREILMLNAFDSEAAGALADELMNNQSLQDLLKYGLIVISSAPILILYPFVKKYFMKGVMIGAVKG